MEITKDSSGTIVFKGQMTVSEAESIHSRLEPLLDELIREVTLDLSEVDEIDISGLQLIFAIKKSFESEGSFRIKGISASVKECILLSGFDMLLKEVS
ncbi:MAG TPA: anti-sigma factor antagonist [Deltaproteobacteria bacterium]|nr:anti-sigma factor antagonist [Deltaproteobacteria bacterium]